MSEPPLDAIEAGLRRRERAVNVGIITFIVGAAVALFVVVFFDDLRSWWRGESNLWGEQTFSARHAGKLGEVDVDLVHRRLLPGWVIALANVDLEGGKEFEAREWGALRAAIAPDANLLEIATELREKALDDPIVHADRLYYLTWAWTQYLEANDIGYVIQSNVAATSRRAFFYVKVYDTLMRLKVSVDGESYPARVVNRVDQTNVREQYLGATTKGEFGATVVVDRILEFATRRVWPALDPANDETLDPLSQAWAEALRAEAAKGLPAASLEALRESAVARKRLIDAVDAIHARHDCGSTFTVSGVPWRGFEPKSVERFEYFAKRALDHPCPDVKLEEAATIAEVSDELAGSSALGEAVRDMVFWLARPIAVHEGRHVADDATVNGLEEAMECDACGDMPGVARAELSSYLATFAWSDAPQTAFFQACDATEGLWGAHGMAMGMVLEAFDSTCEDGPVEDLVARSRELEKSWLGRSQPIRLEESIVVSDAL